MASRDAAITADKIKQEDDVRLRQEAISRENAKRAEAARLAAEKQRAQEQAVQQRGAGARECDTNYRSAVASFHAARENSQQFSQYIYNRNVTPSGPFRARICGLRREIMTAYETVTRTFQRCRPQPRPMIDHFETNFMRARPIGDLQYAISSECHSGNF